MSVKNESVNNCDEQSDKKDDDNKHEKILNSTTIDYWYPPKLENKPKISITDITSGNVTITIRELI